MSEPLAKGEMPTGTVLDPPPDPWSPPRARATQAGSIATAATGTTLLAGAGPGGASLLMLPNPTEIFGRVAHVLGLQFGRQEAWWLGMALIVVSLALNVYSYYLRYRYAKEVGPKWAEQIPQLEREARLGRELQAARPQPRAQGSGGGAA